MLTIVLSCRGPEWILGVKFETRPVQGDADRGSGADMHSALVSSFTQIVHLAFRVICSQVAVNAYLIQLNHGVSQFSC